MQQRGSSKSPEALHSEGIALYRSGRFDEALACYDEALARHPGFAAAFNSRGFLLQDLGRIEQALSDFTQAVNLAPDLAMARLNLGMAQLKLGQFEPGWENYEARWTGAAEAHAGKLHRHDHPLPQWTGENGLQDHRLLVITEQGFGDTFQFVRYLPLLAQRFAKVGFACSAPTQRLMEWSFGRHMATFTRLPTHSDAWGEWDLCCPLMSLPRAFGTRVDTIPDEVPYLRVARPAADHWQSRVRQVAPKRLRVGIAWAGRKEHQADARRSLRFEQLLPLLADERTSWFSLQKWLPGDASPAIPPSVDWFDWTDEGSADFADAAALIEQLDLVISIDSAMVHLAGALGKPVWLLDRFDNEWRWLTGRDDSPWYPSLRIFRQSHLGDWDGVLQRVQAALASLAPPREMGPRVSPAKTNAATHAPNAASPGHAELTIEQAMQLAGQHQNAGRLPQAEGLLRQILQIHAQHAPAQHLLGVVLYQTGQPLAAIELVSKAVLNAPGMALFHSNLAEMYRQQGRPGDAIRHGEQAVSLDPSMASALSNLGIAHYDAQHHEQALQCHHQALKLSPRLLQSLNNLGSIARAMKDIPAAVDWYRQALAVQPDYLESLSNLGAVLLESDEFEAAAEPLERALRLQANYPEARCNLGLLRLKQERIDEAINLLSQSLRLRSKYPEAMVGLALALHEKDQLPEARRLLSEVVALDPRKADAWCHLGTVCQELGDTGEAENAFNQALALDLTLADALTGLGNLRLEHGKIEEAEGLLKQAIGADADHLGARFHLTQVRKVKPGDANLAALEAKLAVVDSLSDEKKISLHYALGKAYDDLREWDKAFHHFTEGARLKRAKCAFDPALEANRIDRIINTVDRDFIRRLHGRGSPSDLPVFVLGMPRSGTTLTEQIIASHPDVHGAGELPDLMAIAQRQSAPAERLPFPDNLQKLTPELLTGWGQDYVEGLRKRHPGVKRITDKMPGNYMALGLIPLMMPHARIIHVKRNPIDTCVSCFTRLFNRHQDATYDLRELGHHYAQYARLMDHWRSVLPSDSFLEVQYEDIVADMAHQARRLIDFTGLPWNDACLAFHETQRIVRTASLAQVRQPIYTSSVERWRHYERHLAPLFEGLGERAAH
jgi:tetratricopeptide (TPR) repeat protein